MTIKEIEQGRKVIAGLQTSLNTLELITEHGDLCKDGMRGVNHLTALANRLIITIEADGDVKGVADHLHKAVIALNDE